MKRFLSYLMLVVFMAPFMTRANEIVVGDKKENEVSFATRDNDPVAEVRATEVSDDEVDLIWSWNSLPLIEDFETGDFNQLPWDNEISDYPWTVTKTNPYEGIYCMKSTNTGLDGTTSAIEVSVNFPKDGLVSFYVKISSEAGWDKGYFYIDGVQMAYFDGEWDWTKREYEVLEGDHTFRWEYTKDNMQAMGEDVMYVDYINFRDEPEPVDPGLLYYDDGIVISNDGLYGEPLEWGVMFPTTMLNGHDGESLTKVLAHGYNINGAYSTEGDYTLKIYSGGDTTPTTLEYTQDFHMTGANEWFEIELTTPLPLDVNQNLWVTLYNETVAFPIVFGADCGDPNSRWICVDTIGGGNPIWMDGNEIHNPWSFMIRAYVTSDSKDGELISPDFERTVQNYNIYRANADDEETAELIGTATDTVYQDMTWGDLVVGEYKYGVSVVYDDNAESPIVWSNILEKDVTSIEENENSMVAIYPNPTKGDLRIEAEGMNRITVTSVLGQVVMDKAVVSDYETIDMSHLKAGIYMIRIVSENGVAVKRVNVVN